MWTERVRSHFSGRSRCLHSASVQQVSPERFAQLVQTVSEYAIFALTPDGHIASWNKGGERIKGYQPDEIIGKHFSVFYPQADIDAGKPARELEIAAREGRYIEEGWRLRKGGQRFWAHVTIT